MEQTSVTPFVRRMDARLIFSVLAAGLMTFTGIVAETAMNITFPTLMREFHAGISSVQWLTTGYLLILGIVIPTSSFLKKRFRMKHIFLFAMSMFILGTVICLLAPSLQLLILGRLIQGLGTGMGLPLTFNIVLEQTPYEHMGFMMGVASLTIALAPAVGPSLGGLIVHHYGWRMIFAVLLPFLIFALFLGLFSIRQSSILQKSAFDKIGYLLLAAGCVCLLIALSQSGTKGFASPLVMSLFWPALVLIILFAWYETKKTHPLINMQIFRYPCFSVSAISLFANYFAGLGLGFVLPNFVQLVHGQSALSAGAMVVPGCIVCAVMIPFAGRAYDKHGALRPVLLGSIFLLLGFILLSIFLLHASMLQIALMYILYMFGLSAVPGNTMTNGIASMPDVLSADGNAICNMIQQLAGAVSTAIVSATVAAGQARFPDNMARGTATGCQRAMILLVCVAAMMCVMAWIGACMRRKAAS